MDICPEKGLGHQDFKCFDCKTLIGMGKRSRKFSSSFLWLTTISLFSGVFGEARVCDYTGAYYCTSCHDNDVSVVPARIVRNWDFRKYKVCKKTKELFRSVYKLPLIPLLRVNPMLETFLEEVRETVVSKNPFLLHLVLLSTSAAPDHPINCTI